MPDLKYRNELKHTVMLSDIYSLRKRISPIMKLDSFAKENELYNIRSLYFDTPEDKALMEKINGLEQREKFRIRFYNYDSSLIKLEKKIKNNKLTAKLSASITKDEVEKVLNGDIEFLKVSDVPLLREFYLKLKLERLLPKTLVEYEREAYEFPAGNIRVTIDSNIRAAIDINDIFNPNIPTLRAIENSMAIIEVKYDQFIPDFILDLVQLRNCTSSSASKYAMCRAYN